MRAEAKRLVAVSWGVGGGKKGVVTAAPTARENGLTVGALARGTGGRRLREYSDG